MKRCPVCDEEKPLEEFHRNRNAADGRQHYCKPCMIAYQAAYRARQTDEPGEAVRQSDDLADWLRRRREAEVAERSARARADHLARLAEAREANQAAKAAAREAREARKAEEQARHPYKRIHSHPNEGRTHRRRSASEESGE